MGRKIDFVNPFGTDRYDAIIRETLAPYAAHGTELVVSHLDGCPENIDYYYYKHLAENAVYERVLEAEANGFDAVVVGCCYDPGVLVARELVDIPVVGPLEAALHLAPYYGHTFSVVTDHYKAVPWIRDMVRLYGGEAKCRSVGCIDWWVTEMVERPERVAADAAAAARATIERDGAEAVILACTIIGACLEREALRHGSYGDVPIINPNIAALKAAETLAELRARGRYAPSRVGFHAKPQDHDRAEFEAVRRRFAWSR